MEQLNRRTRRSLEKGIRRHNNRKNEQSSCQIIWSEPRFTKVGTYLTDKGLYLKKQGVITTEEAWARYGKTRYQFNPNAKAIKVITHRIYHTQY